MMIRQEDKERVLSWLEKHAWGVKCARTREQILPYLNLPDRYFRLIVSELIHEGHVASCASKGYWFVPLHTNDMEEIEALKRSILERKSKALTMIADCDKQLKELAMKFQGQMTLSL